MICAGPVCVRVSSRVLIPCLSSISCVIVLLPVLFVAVTAFCVFLCCPACRAALPSSAGSGCVLFAVVVLAFGAFVRCRVSLLVSVLLLLACLWFSPLAFASLLLYCVRFLSCAAYVLGLPSVGLLFPSLFSSLCRLGRSY